MTRPVVLSAGDLRVTIPGPAGDIVPVPVRVRVGIRQAGNRASVLVHRDSWTVIPHVEPDAISMRRESNVDACCGRVADRVRQEVRQDLLDPATVPVDAQLGRRVDADLIARLRECRGHPFERLPQERRGVERLDRERETPRPDPGDVEQIIDERGDPLELRRRDAKHLRDTLRRRTATVALLGSTHRHLDLQSERRDRCAELVGSDRQELVARVEELLQLLLALDEPECVNVLLGGVTAKRGHRQLGVDTGEQLLRGEWLRQVVVGTEREAARGLVVTSPSGEKDDGQRSQ